MSANITEASAPLPSSPEEYQRLLITGFPGCFTGAIQFLKFDQPELVRAWLQRLAVSFGPAADLIGSDEDGISIAFSHAGLRVLGVNALDLDAFPAAFRMGMPARGKRLGDPAWQALDESSLHAVLLLHTRAPEALTNAMLAEGASVRARPGSVPGFDAASSSVMTALHSFWDARISAHIESSGVSVLHTQYLHRPLAQADKTLKPMEYFGFNEGLSTAPIDDGATPPKPVHFGGKAAHHFVVPARRGLLFGGSYLVVRQLEQYVERFWQQVGSVDQAERVVGATREGTPLLYERAVRDTAAPAQPASAPTQPASAPAQPASAPAQPASAPAQPASAPAARGCPFHAHVPRTRPNTDEIEVPIEILRRGMSYASQDSAHALHRGLMFMAFNADIQAQFEFIQRNWIQGANHVGGSSRARDPLTGLAAKTLPDGSVNQAYKTSFSYRDPDTDTAQVASYEPFVGLVGGGYFFVPGKQAFQALTRGEFAENSSQNGARPDFAALLAQLDDEPITALAPESMSAEERQAAADGAPAKRLQKKYAQIQAWMDDSDVAPMFWTYVRERGGNLRVGTRRFFATPSEVERILEDNGALFSARELGARMETVTAPFFLGMDAYTDAYKRGRSMGRIVDFDAAKLAEASVVAQRVVEGSVAAARQLTALSGIANAPVRIPLIKLLAVLVDRMSGHFFGLPGPSAGSLATWGRDLAVYFFRVGANDQDAANARTSGWQYRAHVDRLVRHALPRIRAEGISDDPLVATLARMKAQLRESGASDEPGPTELAETLLGIVTGSLGATIKVLGEAVKVMVEQRGGELGIEADLFSSLVAGPLAAVKRAAPDALYRVCTTAHVQNGAEYLADETVVVWLGGALATREVTLFGAGPHACPAKSYAIHMINGFFTGLRATGGKFVPGQDASFDFNYDFECSLAP